MKKFLYERLRQRATLLSWIALALLLIGPFMAHFRIVPAFTGFMIYLLSGILGFTGLIFAAVSRHWTWIWASLIPFCAVLSLFIQGRNYPPINDVSTESEHYPDLKPLVMNVPPAAAFEKVRGTSHSMPDWTVTREDPASATIEAVATSWLFRFQDDVTIEIKPHEQGSLVRMRSRSRDGKGDLGTNAARIREFLSRIQQ